MKRSIALLALCHTLFAMAQTIIVPAGSTWKYLDNGSNQGTAWRGTTFNDAAWAGGAAVLGYGDGDEATVVNGGPSGSRYITTYFRRSISIASASSFTGYTLRVKRDDGIVVYVNGTERYRNNMPSGTIGHTTRASGNASDDGATFITSTLPATAFISGTNVIAVEIHQRSSSSSDISFDLELIGTGSTTACGTPGSLSTSALSNTSATLAWGSVSGASTYTVQWRAVGTATWNTVPNLTGTSYSLVSLTSGTAYEFQVQATCSGSSGAFSSPGTFTTTGGATVNEVIYQWSGAVQPQQATVVAKVTTASTTCRLVVSTSAALTAPIFSANATASTANNFMAKMTVTGLTPGTTYFYAVASNGVTDASADDIGKFTTPSAGPFSYSFTVGSCAVSSNHQAYTAMANKAPLFHMATGDFHYANPNSSTNINTHRLPYEQNMLSQTPSRNFLKNTALAFVWDDHDYCGNNSGGSSSGRANARQAYQEYVPHYPLAAGTGNVPIHQSFTVGRVHFILSDLRSERAGSSMMGATQKAWFKNQCLFARDNGLMIAWVSGVSFGGNQSDNWGGFAAERTELSNFFRDNNIRNMFILSGDAHMLAIDNGSNHDFSTGSNNPNDYPVFQAAAVNNSGSTKGGTYSQGGVFPNPNSSTGQYGTVQVTDNGGPGITIAFTGYRTVGNSTSESVLTSYTFTRDLSAPAGMAMQPDLVLRPAAQGEHVLLAWEGTTAGGARLMRVENGAHTPVSNLSTSSGSFTDTTPANGWNHYEVVDGQGKVLATNSIFIQGKAQLELFPNPATTLVNLHVKGLGADADGRYIVYNERMKTVLQGGLALVKGDDLHTVDVSTLEAGLYFVHVVVNGVEMTRTLVVAR
jgi:phosphodiesterase/alkaline phosphatase D-like protein